MMAEFVFLGELSFYILASGALFQVILILAKYSKHILCAMGRILNRWTYFPQIPFSI